MKELGNFTRINLISIPSTNYGIYKIYKNTKEIRRTSTIFVKPKDVIRLKMSTDARMGAVEDYGIDYWSAYTAVLGLIEGFPIIDQVRMGQFRTIRRMF